MQLSSLISLFPLVGLSIATCRSDALEHWGSPEFVKVASFFAGAICNPYDLAGEFAPGATKQVCRNFEGLDYPGYGGAPHPVYYEVKNGGSNTMTLSNEKCAELLAREINGCKTGGVSTYNDFTFTAKPVQSC